MAEGGFSTQRRHAPTWLRSEGLFCAALLVPWQGAPAILDAPQKVDERRLARLCVALARSNALLTAWQALALALVEPELREAIADSEEIAKLDAILGNAPSLAAWFEQPMRAAAAAELRAMLDNAVVLPAVQSASLSQWFDKPVARLASLASEHLALQLEAHGMRALPFVLGVPSSPAFRELAAQSSAQLRRLSASLAESPTRHLAPSLTDRWVADLYMEGRYVGRARSDVVARRHTSESPVRSAESVRESRDSDMPPTIPRALIAPPAIGSRPAPVAPPRPRSNAAPTQRVDEVAFGDDAREPIAERAIDEEWITLADLHAAPRVEVPRPQAEIGLSPPGSDADVAAVDRATPSSRQRRASVHLGLAIFAGALVGSAAVAMFMALAGRDDRRPALERDHEAEPNASVALPSVPAATVDPLPVAEPEPAPAPVVVDLDLAPPLGSATAPPTVSPVVTPKTPISKTCDLALMYAQRGEIAQAIRRLENCESPERELVRERIGQRGAADVRAKAEKGQCDEAGAIVAQVESIEAAAAAKVAFASLCNSRAREVENETAGP